MATWEEKWSLNSALTKCKLFWTLKCFVNLQFHPTKRKKKSLEEFNLTNKVLIMAEVIAMFAGRL